MDGKTSIDDEDLDKMTYVTAVIEETLRLYPSAPTVQKSNQEELELISYKIPKGTEILVSICNYSWL